MVHAPSFSTSPARDDVTQPAPVLGHGPLVSRFVCPALRLATSHLQHFLPLPPREPSCRHLGSNDHIARDLPTLAASFGQHVPGWQRVQEATSGVTVTTGDWPLL